MKRREINEIIIHCSASEWGDAKVIDEWHRARGWDGIGYHYVLLNGRRKYHSPYNPNEDGNIELGRPIEKIGAHCKGHNKNSIGICLIGDHHFSYKQFYYLHKLITSLKYRYGTDRVVGHYEYNPNKTCPNFKIDCNGQLVYINMI